MFECGRLRRAPSRYGSEASIPTTVQPRSANATDITPVPHPTSSTRSPALTPTKSRNGPARRRLQRAMKCSYSSASVARKLRVAKLMAGLDSKDGANRHSLDPWRFPDENHQDQSCPELSGKTYPVGGWARGYYRRAAMGSSRRHVRSL